MSENIKRLAEAARRPAATRLAAAVVPFLITLLLSTVRDSVTGATAVLVLVLWVVVTAASGDRFAALIAAVSAGAWFDFFLTEPYQRFVIDDPHDVEDAGLLVLIGIAVTEIALWGYRQRERSARRSGYLEGVLGAAQVIAEGVTPVDAVVELIGRRITDVLDADRCLFVAGPVTDPRIAVLDHDGVVTRDGRAVDVDRVGLPSDEYVAVPVQRGPQTTGHFLVNASSHVAYPSREQRRVAVLLADQVPAASGAS